MSRVSLKDAHTRLAAVGRRLYARGWVLGTSGNFSTVIARRPLTLAITATFVDKSALHVGHILTINGRGERVGRGSKRSSAESRLHLEIVRQRSAGAVLHTHSIWGTMLSDAHVAHGGVELAGYEMLKGLAGVTTHEHKEWVPIIANDQDMIRLSRNLGDALERAPAAHAVLLHRHGLYTWGASLDEAVRHVEVLEFLFETIGRTTAYDGKEAP